MTLPNAQPEQDSRERLLQRAESVRLPVAFIVAIVVGVIYAAIHS